MELNEIIKIQNDFDEKHGWLMTEKNIQSYINYLSQDSIGLLGELGEFANHIKKLNILVDHEEELSSTFEDIKSKLQGEIVDVFVYLVRLSTHLDMDLEKKYLEKLSFNAERFKKYEN